MTLLCSWVLLNLAIDAINGTGREINGFASMNLIIELAPKIKGLYNRLDWYINCKIELEIIGKKYLKKKCMMHSYKV